MTRTQCWLTIMEFLQASSHRLWACNGNSARRLRFDLHWEARSPPDRTLLFREISCNLQALLPAAADFLRTIIPTPTFRGSQLSLVLSRDCTCSGNCKMLNSKLGFPATTIPCAGPETSRLRLPVSTRSA